MKYILADVKRKVDREIQKKSYYIENDSVSYVNEKMDKLKFTRLNMNGFTLAAGHIMNDFNLINFNHKEAYKVRFKRLIEKGCTTIVTYPLVENVDELNKKLRLARHQLINSPIDFMIGIQTTLTGLTPLLIRKCRREKVPIIRLNINSIEDLYKVSWERMKEAMINYQLLIIPNWTETPVTRKKEEKLVQVWGELSNQYRIPTHLSFPDEHEPFPKVLSKKAGLYPRKSELIVGSDVDYILYQNDEVNKDSMVPIEPAVVVLRGKVIKAGESIYYKPGFGREVRINVPRHFLPISEAYKEVMDY
ncbi:hypothetical protein [Alkalihalobacterium alkalinitrilicum]|uniref:hypothetical protein n=1 Tax=Alkalihalobacterium alkalinitrilicum TaxID=427920 RepID=UPI0009954942|nr:hypothetical protein [Alkalihalobacterium alkalinitrilicum]